MGLKPEIIFANTRPVLEELRRETSAIPIVFALVSDPLGGGFVESLAHPGGNITGFAGWIFQSPENGWIHWTRLHPVRPE